MPLVPSLVRNALVPWAFVGIIVSCSSAGASAEGWPCRLIPVSTLRSVIEKGMEKSETIRRQCEELAAARAVVVLEWGVTDAHTHAWTNMEVREGVVVAIVKLPPLGDTIVLMAHELQHVIELTRGLDVRAEAKRTGSGVWQSYGGYETKAAVDAGRRVAEELRASAKAAGKRSKND